MNVIAKYMNHQWSQVEGLNHGRYYHGSIQIGNQIMIIGGSTRITNKWETVAPE